MIVDPKKRRQQPDNWYAVTLRLSFVHLENIDDAEGIFPDYWNDMFALWTEPFPVRKPKAYSLYGVQPLRSYIQMGYYDDWPDTWWSQLEDAFMFPEYKKVIK